MQDEWCYTLSVGLNFLDHPPRVPRTLFIEPEEALASKTAPKQQPGSDEVGTVLFRTLKRFPEAYRAVVEALRQLSPDLVPA